MASAARATWRACRPSGLLAPLHGHTLGHAGIAVRGADGRWLLQAGDAYFHHRELDPEPYCTPGLHAYQWMMEKARRARLGNQRRLRALQQAHAGGIEICCGHDNQEFERLTGRSILYAAGSSA